MYTQLFSSNTPGCIVILIDQSGSMSEGFNGAQPDASNPSTRKDGACAMAVNRVLREVALASQKGEVISARCHVGIIGYGGGVMSAFGGSLQGRELVPIPDVANTPRRVDTVRKREPDGAGGLVELDVPFPIWVEPAANGGTPMAEALELAASWLGGWVSAHGSSFPPVIINITDGEPNDADRAMAAAQALGRLQTSDGAALLLNVHISKHRGHAICMPDSDAGLPDEYAKFLFRMSSVLPAPLRASAEAQGFRVTGSSRGFVYNADADALVRLLTFGSLPNAGR